MWPNEITAGGGYPSVHIADLAHAQPVSVLARDLLAREGTPHVLINNAGAGRWLTVEETSSVELEQMMAVPFFAAFNLTRELLPSMRQRGSGHIVNVTSVAARLVFPGAAASPAARCAMLSFSESLRTELAGSGIRVTVGIFGTVDTPYWAHNPGSEQRLPRAGARLMRHLTADEVAQALADGIERDAIEIRSTALLPSDLSPQRARTTRHDKGDEPRLETSLTESHTGLRKALRPLGAARRVST